MTPVKKILKRWIALFALFSIELVLAITLFLISLIIFWFVWRKFILLKQDQFDYTVFKYVDNITDPDLTLLLRGITHLGGFYFLLSICIILFIYFLFIKKHHWYSLKIPVVAAGSIFVNLILKGIFSRPRPEFPLAEAGGFSFPSGHAMVAFSFYGLLIYVAWREIKNKKLRLGICFVLLMLIHLIGFSRIYLRVHFASDVMAGFAVGIIWLIISILSLRKLERFSKRKLDPMVQQ